MKPHTYTFQYHNLATGEILEGSIEAKGKELAYKAAMCDTRFKKCLLFKSSFRRTDTAKGPNRAGGLNRNGKQIDARTAYEKAKEATIKEVNDNYEASQYKLFLKHLDLAIDHLYQARMENNAAVLSLPIKQLYEEMKDYNPFK